MSEFNYNSQGVLGIKVKIMLDWDPKGKVGPTTPLPDLVTIHTPKEEQEYSAPAFTPVLEVPSEWKHSFGCQEILHNL